MSLKKLNKESFSLVLLIILFRLTLDIGYIFFINPIFYYSGFELNISAIKILESYIYIVLLSIIVKFNLKKPSDFLIIFLFTISILPTTSYYALSDQNRFPMLCMLLFFVIVLFISNLRINFNIKKPKNGKFITFAIIIFLNIVVFISLILHGGLNYLNFDLSKVYLFRGDVNDNLFSGIWGYLNNWSMRIANMFLFAYSLLKKKKVLLATSLLLQIVFFGISSHKSVLFYPFLIFAIYIFFKSKHIVLKYFSLAWVFQISLLLIAFFTNIYILPSLFIRRVFFVPALLNFKYYEFFTDNNFVYLSNSIFSSFIRYPYADKTAKLIGAYLGSPEMNANNGTLATGYMHFGIIGVIVFALIAGIMLSFINYISRDLPTWFCVSIFIVPFFALFTSSDLFTTLFTHGLGLNILLLWLYTGTGTKITLQTQFKVSS